MRALLTEAGQSPQSGFDLGGEAHKRFLGFPAFSLAEKRFLRTRCGRKKRGFHCLRSPIPPQMTSARQTKSGRMQLSNATPSRLGDR